jgi:hypothetical protein
MNQIPKPLSIKPNPKIPNDICHKPYENLNYTNLIKKSLNDICPKPKKLYKLYNAK